LAAEHHPVAVRPGGGEPQVGGAYRDQLVLCPGCGGDECGVEFRERLGDDGQQHLIPVVEVAIDGRRRDADPSRHRPQRHSVLAAGLLEHRGSAGHDLCAQLRALATSVWLPSPHATSLYRR
jgi:hypothetical protein